MAHLNRSGAELDNPERPTSSSALLSSKDGGARADAADLEGSETQYMALTRRKSGGGSPVEAAGSSTNGLEDSDYKSNADREMNPMQSDDDDTLADDEETGLTQAQRKQRTQRKTHNARLDGQVSGAASIRSGVSGISSGSGGTTEAKLIAPTLVKNMIINGVLIGLWYSFSISISVYNKWMFSGENLDFHFPLFTTSMHMLVQFCLASSVLYFLPRFRPGNDGSSNPHDPSYSRVNTSEDDDADDTTTPATKKPPSNEPLMTKIFYLTRIGPCGTATAMDIGLGNFSLRFISLTFFTMCKSSVLAFVLLFAFIFHLEQPTWRLCAIISFMTIGVIMMVAGETAFNALGFVLVMLASFCSGFRWSLTQILLLRNRATSNPFSSIFFLTPVMFLALFILAVPIEGPANVVQGVKDLAKSEGAFLSFLLLLFPGILAFLMVSAEFALLKRTSVVTLSVCGIFKEVLTISAAGVVFGDELSPINVSGLFVTIASIAAYNYLKYTKMKKEAAQEAHEIFVEEAADAAGIDRSKDAVVAGPPAQNGGGGMHLQTDNVGHDHTQVNGVVASAPGKKPEHVK